VHRNLLIFVVVVANSGNLKLETQVSVAEFEGQARQFVAAPR
jgi:hypothetical protein